MGIGGPDQEVHGQASVKPFLEQLMSKRCPMVPESMLGPACHGLGAGSP
jgi:hypothetical protein